MRNKVTVSEYLAFLSIKYEVDPDELFYALISAEENQESTCGKLSIKCRSSKLHDKKMILITKGPKVVAQFPISKEFFLNRSNPLRNLRETDMLRRYLTKKSKEARSLRVKDLKTGMKQVNLKAKVLKIPKPTLVFTRFGNYANVANASIADETGTIKLCLWNEQISFISVGDTVQIKNAHVSVFKGERQLRIGRNGTLSIVNDTHPPDRLANQKMVIANKKL